MKIFYNEAACSWYQTSMKQDVTFGGKNTLLPYQKKRNSPSLAFQIHLENQHAGPFIGIITARKEDGTIAGNSALFIKLQKKLLLHGGISYIFTPDDVHKDYINGYMYFPDVKQWKKIKAPYPDLVYNRIPFRKVEQEEPYETFFSILELNNIPFFNPCFLHKYELYTILENNHKLKNFLPKTMLVTDQQSLYTFLTFHSSVYLKPSHSAKGKGIFRLAYRDPHLSLEGLKRKETYPEFADFWREWEMELLSKQYLVQEEINSRLYKGQKYDFRILAHAQKDHYIVTGVGVRQAEQQDITTHIPNGGKLLPYDLFHTEELDRFINMAVNLIGDTLTREYGFFGEFSIDAGVSIDGDYFIYEVNSKPMSFDETEIEEKKIEQLCALFFELTHFSPAHEKEANTTD
jgi:hypothetical protein